MKNLILSLLLLVGGSVTAQTFDFSCTPDVIPNVAPTVELSYEGSIVTEITVNVNEQYTLSAFTGDDKGIVAYSWSDDDRNIQGTGGFTTSWTWSHGRVSVHPITLHVEDAEGEYATATVIVNVVEPTTTELSGIIVAPSTSIEVGDIYTLNIRNFEFNNGPYSIEWSMGGIRLGGQSSISNNHDSAGMYRIDLTITDGDRNIFTAFEHVFVNAPEPPPANLTYNTLTQADIDRLAAGNSFHNEARIVSEIGNLYAEYNEHIIVQVSGGRFIAYAILGVQGLALQFVVDSGSEEFIINHINN